jgi:hypothetical protein
MSSAQGNHAASIPLGVPEMEPEDSERHSSDRFSMVDGPVGPGPSVGSSDQLALISDTVDGIYIPEKPTLVVDGWVAAAAAAPKIEVQSRASERFCVMNHGKPCPGRRKGVSQLEVNSLRTAK